MTTLCRQEEKAVAAALNDRLDAPLMSHLETCESCRAAVAVISLLKPDAPCRHEDTADIHMREMIWTRALYAARQRRRRLRKLGWAVGAVFGILAGCLTGVFAMPSNPAISLSQAVSVLSHSLPALAPSALILLAVLFVFCASPATGPLSRRR